MGRRAAARVQAEDAVELTLRVFTGSGHARAALLRRRPPRRAPAQCPRSGP
jgi:hypothetical protein